MENEKQLGILGYAFDKDYRGIILFDCPVCEDPYSFCSCEILPEVLEDSNFIYPLEVIPVDSMKYEEIVKPFSFESKEFDITDFLAVSFSVVFLISFLIGV